jgi:hypothetical protein
VAILPFGILNWRELMKKLPSLAVYALMAPAITLGIGSALATEPPAGAYGAKEQRTTQEQQRQMPAQAQKEKGMATADRAQEQRMAEERAKQRREGPWNLPVERARQLVPFR